MLAKVLVLSAALGLASAQEFFLHCVAASSVTQTVMVSTTIPNTRANCQTYCSGGGYDVSAFVASGRGGQPVCGCTHTGSSYDLNSIVKASSTSPGDGECKMTDGVVDYLNAPMYPFVDCLAMTALADNPPAAQTEVKDAASCEAFCAASSYTNIAYGNDGAGDDMFSCLCFSGVQADMGPIVTCGPDTVYVAGPMIVHVGKKGKHSKSLSKKRNMDTRGNVLCPNDMTACNVRGVTGAFEVSAPVSSFSTIIVAPKRRLKLTRSASTQPPSSRAVAAASLVSTRPDSRGTTHPSTQPPSGPSTLAPPAHISIGANHRSCTTLPGVSTGGVTCANGACLVSHCETGWTLLGGSCHQIETEFTIQL